MWALPVVALVAGILLIGYERLGAEYQRRARLIERTKTIPIADAESGRLVEIKGRAVEAGAGVLAIAPHVDTQALGVGGSTQAPRCPSSIARGWRALRATRAPVLRVSGAGVDTPTPSAAIVYHVLPPELDEPELDPPDELESNDDPPDDDDDLENKLELELER